MTFKGLSIFSFGGHFVQWSGTILAILIEGCPRNISVKLFINRATGLGGDGFFLALVPLCSAERNHFSNFGRGSPKEHFCEIILKSGHWPSRRCFSTFSSGGHFVQWSVTILAILIEGHLRNLSVKLF